MTAKIPQPGDLEPIETASRDEISALQLERLKWSLFILVSSAGTWLWVFFLPCRLARAPVAPTRENTRRILCSA